MELITAQFKGQWKYRWLAVELGWRTAIVLAKTFLSGSKHAQSAVLLLLVCTYYVLLVRCKPYTTWLIMEADGALFYTAVVSGMTQVTLIISTLVFTEANDGAKQSQLMEVFVLSIIALWLLLVVWLLWQYFPRFSCKRSAVDSSDSGTELGTKLHNFHQNRHKNISKRRANRLIIHVFYILAVVLGGVCVANGNPASMTCKKSR